MNRSIAAENGRVLAGLVAPCLCMAHCLAAPLLVVAMPGIAEAPLVETGLIAASIATAAAVARRGGRLHGRRRAWLPVVLGIAFLLISRVGKGEEVEQVLTVAGSLALLIAVAWDARLRAGCACDGCACARVGAEHRPGSSGGARSPFEGNL